jgi:hypothetical protein
MPAPVQPIKRPPPIAANVNRAWWSSCIHYVQSQPGCDKCDLPGQAKLLPFTTCGKCKHYTHRDPL